MSKSMDTNNPLAVPTIRDFLFGSEQLEGIKPTTKSLGDTALVLIRPVYIGKLCQTFDEEESLFHVEYASNVDKTWAEIWLSKEWQESNTRRTRAQNRSSAERITRETNNRRVGELKGILTKQFSSVLKKQANEAYMEYLAKQILEYHKAGKTNEVIAALNLAEKLNNYDKEDEETKQRIKQVTRELSGETVQEGTSHAEDPIQRETNARDAGDDNIQTSPAHGESNGIGESLE